MDAFAFLNGQLIHGRYIESTPWPTDFAVRAILVEATEDEWRPFLTFVGAVATLFYTGYQFAAHASSYRTVSYLRVEMYQLA